MSSVVAVVCLVVLSLMSVVRATYRICAWDDASGTRSSAEEMFAAAAAMLMGILSIAALVAAAQPFTH